MFNVYSKHDCVWCDRAIALLVKNGQKFNIIYVDVEPLYLEEFKQKFPGAKTVPQIETYYNDNGDRTYERIGGYEDLVRYFR